MPRLTNLDFTEARDSERQWHQLSYASLLLTPDKQYENNVIQADNNNNNNDRLTAFDPGQPG